MGKNALKKRHRFLNMVHHFKTNEILKKKQLVLNWRLCAPPQKRQELEGLSEKRTTALTWAGLGMMSVQFGILARLTWWEYSWDIMEPVTYFVTYGTAMAAYAYFVLTKQVCHILKSKKSINQLCSESLHVIISNLNILLLKAM